MVSLSEELLLVLIDGAFGSAVIGSELSALVDTNCLGFWDSSEVDMDSMQRMGMAGEV